MTETLTVINQELQETSINEESQAVMIMPEDEGMIPMDIDTERSAVKVSMIKKNNEILYEDRLLTVDASSFDKRTLEFKSFKQANIVL